MDPSDCNPRLLREDVDRTSAEQLARIHRMEAMGTLARGIAHDFNNILASILACAEVSLLKVPPGHPARHYLEQILTAGERGGELVKQILDFSRMEEQGSMPVRVADIVEEALKLLHPSLPANVKIEHKINTNDGIVMGDSTQIHRILSNLCANALHAMRAKGGTLKVVLDEIILYEEDCRAHGETDPGPYVRLMVSDTGHGMDSRILKRIFAPYFTTKQKGEGSGMGLSVVKGIVKGLGGVINVESEVNRGTRFEVLIPATDNGYVREKKNPGDIPGGKECILVVDDEEILVETTKAILTKLGYEVDGSTSAVAALELIRSEPDRYDMVITDQRMPAMTGVELAGLLKESALDIPIILCTGFGDVVSQKEAAAIGIRAYVMKPVLTGPFARTIRNVLDEDDSEAAQGWIPWQR